MGIIRSPVEVQYKYCQLSAFTIMHNTICFGVKSLQIRTEVHHFTDLLCVQYRELLTSSFPDYGETKGSKMLDICPKCMHLLA